MGKATGFLEYERKNCGKEKPLDRLNHWNEFDTFLSDTERREQGARCMDCGVPFCQSGIMLNGMVTGCPINNLIPEWNHLIYLGKWEKGLERLLKTNNFPEFTSRVCPAPCEGACRRKSVDEPVSICLLKRFAGDHGAYHDEKKPSPKITDKKIAIIGAGPAGLSAAYYLSRSGYICEVFDENEKPGGMLRYGVPEENLPRDVLDREIERILNEGIIMKLGLCVDKQMFDEILATYDAVIIATGNIGDQVKAWEIKSDQKGILAEKKTYQTSVPKVFAAGNVLRSLKMAVRSVGQGKEAAISVRQFLSGKKVTGPLEIFNSRFGRLLEEEITEYLKESHDGNRVDPVKELTEGYSMQEVIREASRCLHCDCRDIQTCQLRIVADQYGANQRRFLSEKRNPVKKKYIHDTVIYEPAKCIKCGICVRLTARFKEKFGFTYIGRGFDVQIGIPFNKDLRSALAETAEKIAQACPTGALAKI